MLNLRDVRGEKHMKPGAPTDARAGRRPAELRTMYTYQVPTYGGMQ